MERMMLRSIIERTRVFDKTKLKCRMDRLRAKLNATILHDKVRPVQSTVYTFKGSISYEGKEDIIDLLCSCIEERARAAVTYRSPSSAEDKTCDIEPLTLVDHGNTLYVIVAIPKHNRNIRILAVDRIKKLVKTGEVFEIPDGFDPHAYLTPSFGITVEEPLNVQIRFTAEAAFYIRERVWGQNQSIQECEDGSIILSFSASGIKEIAAWALSWGKGARVLEPDILAVRVRDELAGAAAGYGEG